MAGVSNAGNAVFKNNTFKDTAVWKTKAPYSIYMSQRDSIWKEVGVASNLQLINNKHVNWSSYGLCN